jgi:hypothetical protein
MLSGLNDWLCEQCLQGCSAAKLCITLANKKAEAVKMRRKTASLKSSNQQFIKVNTLIL